MSEPSKTLTAGIRCPACKLPQSAVQSTERDDGVVIRKRKCKGCGKNFQTREAVIGAAEAALYRYGPALEGSGLNLETFLKTLSTAVAAINPPAVTSTVEENS